MGERLFELAAGGLTLRGRTRGGVETCLQVREHKLMFDVGRCPASAVRYGNVFCTHGHADHLGAIAYFLSQRGLHGLPAPDVHLPVDVVEPLERILAAWEEIEDHQLPVRLHGLHPGDEVSTGKQIRVRGLEGFHRVPSLGWAVEREDRKLKDEYRECSGEELGKLRAEGVDITHEVRVPLLVVSGDTRIEFFETHEVARRAKVLVHEVTSWDQRRDIEATRHWGHTHVDEMIRVSERFEGEALVLVHRSLRHSRKEAEAIVRERFPASVRDRVLVFD